MFVRACKCVCGWVPASENDGERKGGRNREREREREEKDKMRRERERERT